MHPVSVMRINLQRGHNHTKARPQQSAVMALNGVSFAPKF
jgi:hypothetical protein